MRHGPPAHRALLGILLAAGLVAAACGSQATPPSASTKSGGYTIALSNSYTGNFWRKTMLKTWTQAAKDAQGQGLINSYTVVNTPDNSATEQIAQIQSLILKKVDAIDIDAASGTALNSVITQACRAGIIVVVFDSLASAPCEYNLSNPFADAGTVEATAVVNAIHGQGNVIVVHGIVGSQPESLIYNAQIAVLQKYPNIHIVATVVGQGTDSITQSAIESVLPSLPTISGVVDDGVGAGVAAAFQHLGKPLPAFDFGISGTSLALFNQLHQQSGLQGVAIGTVPGQASAALWETIDLLQHTKFDGKSIPHDLTFPNIEIHPDTLSQWASVTPATNVATWVYTHSETDATILANVNNTPLPVPPVPSAPPTG